MSASPSSPAATNSPRVSVICAFLDEERYLDEAIASVMAQDFADLELILVDDGSSDASPEIAERWRSGWPGRIRILHHPAKANKGPGASRNLGLSSARGEYVAFIDGDDVWRPRKLSEQVSLLAADPRLVAVCGTVNYWASHRGGVDQLLPTGHLRDAACDPPEALVTIYPLGQAHAPCPSDLLIRKSAIDDMEKPFEESFVGPYQLYEDQTFLARLYLRGRIHFSSSVWLDYRLHDRSCVARSHRQGTYDTARRRWLDWLVEELEQGPDARTDAVNKAVARFRWQVEHPLLARLKTRLYSWLAFRTPATRQPPLSGSK